MRDMIWTSVDGVSWQRIMFDRFHTRIFFLEDKSIYKLNVKSIDNLENNWSQHETLEEAKLHAATVCHTLMEQEKSKPVQKQRIVGRSWSPKQRKARSK